MYRSHFDTIIFVTTSALTNSEEVSPLVEKVIQRSNIGFDFSSWKLGLEQLVSPDDYFEVIFCNSSVYGPLYGLEQALLSPTVKDADFWGMSYSRQVQPHIQSYFFSMRCRLFATGIAQQFWQGIEALPNKQDVIDRYEVTMMEWFQDRGCHVGSIYHPPDEDFRNPSLFMWRDLLIRGVPYLKVALLSEEPGRAEIMNYTRRISRFPQHLIDNHLARIQTTPAKQALPTCSS
jgi:lipopolysaccharide biosynthesis protein